MIFLWIQLMYFGLLPAFLALFLIGASFGALLGNWRASVGFGVGYLALPLTSLAIIPMQGMGSTRLSDVFPILAVAVVPGCLVAGFVGSALLLALGLDAAKNRGGRVLLTPIVL